ncbi:MAG: alkaline phosphatase family protein [Gemmatimonadota bacterium]
MRRLRTFALALATVLAGCAPSGDPAPSQEGAGGTPRANAPERRDAPYVVLLSLDGFRWDYLDRYPTPALQRMAREGARAERMIPAFPTKTYPTHYTVATGLHPDHHGLVGNRFWAPDRGDAYTTGDRTKVEDGSWYRGEPIWVTAERQGMLAAASYFVGTEADIGGVRPTYWHRYDGSVPNAERVDTVLSWLALPPERRPHMVTLYFSDLDDMGHTYGADSEEAREAVERVDEQVGRLLEGIDALPIGGQVYLVVVSDHGMLRAEAARTYTLDLTPFAGVRMVESGPYASLVVDEGGPGRLPALRDSLQALLPEATVWLRQEIPARFHYAGDPRVGDLLVLADPGATVVEPGRERERDTFEHGWDNQTPEMGAVFLARGPGIAGGQVIPAFESIHVYPFLARVLGLEPAAVDGRAEVLEGILEVGR